MSAYSMTTPCPKCPFRTDITPYLHPGRVLELERSLVTAEFPCHLTTSFDGQEEDDTFYVPSGDEIHCAGALILLEKLERPSQMMRICERLGFYDRRKLKMNAPVYNNFSEMERGCSMKSRPTKK